MDVVVREREHPAAGVRDHERLLGPEQPVRDDERAKRVVGDDAAGVSDHVCVALVEPEELRRVEARVHASDDREAPAGRGGKVALVEALRVASVGFEYLVANRHCTLPSSLALSFLKQARYTK